MFLLPLPFSMIILYALRWFQCVSSLHFQNWNYNCAMSHLNDTLNIHDCFAMFILLYSFWITLRIYVLIISTFKLDPSKNVCAYSCVSLSLKCNALHLSTNSNYTFFCVPSGFVIPIPMLVFPLVRRWVILQVFLPIRGRWSTSDTSLYALFCGRFSFTAGSSYSPKQGACNVWWRYRWWLWFYVPDIPNHLQA